MDHVAYAVEGAVEEDHWWFVGRRRLFAKVLLRAGLSSESRVLDVGTSTGTNLKMLRALGCRHAIGLDISEEAIRQCEMKGLGPVRKGDVCALPFADMSFDFVLATDVIEHVEDDGRALREVARILSPGGKALITVPAFRALWGLQDDLAHHKRRYRLPQLRRLVSAAGMHACASYYFNYLLFLPIWVARRLIGLCGLGVESENRINTPAINRILVLVFGLDVSTASFVRPPFGVSALVIAEKPASRP